MLRANEFSHLRRDCPGVTSQEGHQARLTFALTPAVLALGHCAWPGAFLFPAGARSRRNRQISSDPHCRLQGHPGPRLGPGAGRRIGGREAMLRVRAEAEGPSRPRGAIANAHAASGFRGSIVKTR
jgi:hypothetical protein